MDSIQEKQERAVGDAFVEWYNDGDGTAYQYHDRGADPPDLIYRCGADELWLEITVAYYDADHAAAETQVAILGGSYDESQPNLAVQRARARVASSGR